jgi:general stress protein YciG
VASKRGFASMSDEKVSEIAGKGGRAAHAAGTAHRFTKAEAQRAGKKGGDTISRDREHMAEIGRKGGRARAKQKADESTEEE